MSDSASDQLPLICIVGGMPQFCNMLVRLNPLDQECFPEVLCSADVIRLDDLHAELNLFGKTINSTKNFRT